MQKNTNVVYRLSANVNGASAPFEIVNASFTDTKFVTEVAPDPENSFGILFDDLLAGIFTAVLISIPPSETLAITFGSIAIKPKNTDAGNVILDKILFYQNILLLQFS